MYWTWPSLVFFIILLVTIFSMTVWDVLSPCKERKGFLPIATTRGDRLFIGIISTIGFYFLWLGIAGYNLFIIAIVLSVIWNITMAIRG